MPLEVVIKVGLLVLAGSFLFFKLMRKSFLGTIVFVLVVLIGLHIFVPCFSLWGSVLCEGPSNQKWITLTFDDGPNEPYTSQVLEILKKYQVPAAFFPVGKHIRQFPQTFQKIVEYGYTVGNHGTNHHPLVFVGKQKIFGEIEGWEKAAKAVSPGTFHFFRAPHGWKNFLLESVLKEKGYTLVGWTVGLWDSDQPGKEILLERFKARLQNGMILLLHDGDGDRDHADRSQTVALLPELIEYARVQGFKFVTLDKMLELSQ